MRSLSKVRMVARVLAVGAVVMMLVGFIAMMWGVAHLQPQQLLSGIVSFYLGIVTLWLHEGVWNYSYRLEFGTITAQGRPFNPWKK